MRSIALSIAAAAMLALTAPAVANSTSAPATQSKSTDFSSRDKIVIKEGHHAHRDNWRRHHRHHRHDACRTVVTKSWHHGRKIVKRTRVCR
jgi:Ni/Co efflux regulator RcnB